MCFSSQPYWNPIRTLFEPYWNPTGTLLEPIHQIQHIHRMFQTLCKGQHKALCVKYTPFNRFYPFESSQQHIGETDGRTFERRGE